MHHLFLATASPIENLNECIAPQLCQNVLRRAPAFDKLVSRRRVPCAKSVPESDLFMPLGLALSEKQIPQIAENTEKSK
jgi:hypothetical protein